MQLTIKRPKEWPSLKDNDSVYLISPASASSDYEMKKAINLLEKWNLKPIIYQHKNKNSEPFLSHNDEARLEELKNALYGTESSTILCMRGGYGSARLLPELEKLTKPKKTKLLTGFSDITSLHLFFNNYWNLPTLHSPVIKQFANNEIDKKSAESLKEILFSNEVGLSYPIQTLNKKASSINTRTELPPLIGGNLSLIQTSISTPWSIPEKSKYCLLIEEVNEESYQLDRMLRHLRNTNILNNCQALFIADIIEKSDKNNQKHLSHILKDFISILDIPIFSIKNIGHGKINLPIFLGVPSCLVT